jgi:hypothetical protein
MKCAYFDCFSGASGDMTLAALVDAGCPIDVLQELVDKLGLPGVSIRVETVRPHGLAAARVHVELGPETGHKHRHLPRIIEIIDRAGIAPRAADRAKAVFARLAEAEAAVHGSSIEKVHFHEVGADDAIVDIVGACVALEHLGIERVVCSPIPTGSGTVNCAHGLMPVPAPATARLLRGVPLQSVEEPGELTTPTGAALMAELADEFGSLPAMRLAAIGVGTGTREGKTRPNILRVLIGEMDAANQADVDHAVVLETQVDDVSGQVLANTAERLLAAGALDVYVVPIIMKKGRPGQLLTVLSRSSDVGSLEDMIFEHTGTFGIRRQPAVRRILARTLETVETDHGPVRVKVGRQGDRVVRAWPEYEDCARLAIERGVSLFEVQQAALREWSRRGDAGVG